ncbi:arylsulfatase [Candidatus Poriferisocius sp.]|uniref:arylsulfatase n=1 Tax=Candidatus Poriferisocius sp. TaxID=3101276 RepID=UPI003B5B65AC
MSSTLGTDPTTPPGAYQGWEGRVGRTMAGSDPWWAEAARAPEGAPNIVVVLVDDLGFADLGCYGSEIDTPHIDRMAAEGLRYLNFHVNPMCSPTRASLLTGLNHHDVGVGHVCHSDPGFPGYTAELTEHCATMAEILQAAGYATLMVGKWHLCKDSNLVGPRHSWPLQRGFDHYYGILDGFTNFHHPHRLIRDNSVVRTDRYPDDYYFTDDITDEAIAMVREQKAARPDQPFFLYLAHGAVHAPLQAKEADMTKYRGAYNAGWDEIRDRRYRRQIELGIVDAGTTLAPRNTEEGNDVTPWDELSPVQQEVFARYMEVFAAMVDNVDQNFGRLRGALEDLGEWDNTLVLFTSDNGASREGEDTGCSQYFEILSPTTGDVAVDHARLDLLGGPQTLAHYPRGWAMAGNTPFRLYKCNTHAGGHQVAMISSWPDGLADPGGLRRQYLHITDVLPTVLDVVGLPAPSARNGAPLKGPLAGASFAATFTDAGAPEHHPEQYYEQQGHRGFYRQGWEAVTLHRPMTPFGDHEWEVYHLAEDPTEMVDLSDAEPERRQELIDAWEAAAHRYQVYPLDEGSMLKFVQRPPSEQVYEAPVRITPGTDTLERYRSMKLIAARSFTVDTVFRYADGDAGMLVAHGDQGGGYALYIDDGELVYCHNGYGHMRHLSGGPPAPGNHTVRLAFTITDGFAWDLRILVDGAEVAAGEGFTGMWTMAPFEGIDVGIDRRSPVSWDIYRRHGPFPYTNTIESVTYTPGEPGRMASIHTTRILKEMGARFE